MIGLVAQPCATLRSGSSSCSLGYASEVQEFKLCIQLRENKFTPELNMRMSFYFADPSRFSPFVRGASWLQDTWLLNPCQNELKCFGLRGLGFKGTESICPFLDVEP